MNDNRNILMSESVFTNKFSIIHFAILSSFRKIAESLRYWAKHFLPARFRVSALSTFLICLLNYPYVQAQSIVNQSSLIEIKVETSRPQQTVGTGIGVIADIKNVSDSKVYLHEKRVTMTLPPELEGPFKTARGWWAFFPTVWSDQYERFNNAIALQPGDTYKVFWTKNPEAPEPPNSFFESVLYTIRSELKFIFFIPGEYKISVLAQYWTDPSLPENDYRTVSQSISLPVAAPQSVILLGAALGGLIAYFILPYGRRRLITPANPSDTGTSVAIKKISKEGAGILGAILLSAMVTILLSRISETQFVIRVTVNDFWGAIAIGFVANYAGTKILDKIIPETNKTSASQKKPAQKPTKTTKKRSP